MSDIGSVPNAIAATAGVKEVVEAKESEVAEIKIEISDAVGYMQTIGRYFEGFAGLLVKNGLPAGKQSEAGQSAIALSEKLSFVTVKLEDLGQALNGIGDDAQTLMDLMQAIIDEAQ
jgi:hypothetical protein